MQSSWADAAYAGFAQQQQHMRDVNGASMDEAMAAASASVSTSAPASTPAGACRFVHNQCETELFTSEYLRSNKASGHKNLRCFPHCCGGHNPKSFCGSGLVVEVGLPSCQLVLGRFEELAKQPPPAPAAAAARPPGPATTSLGRPALAVGRAYPRQELLDEVKTPEQPFGKWFRGSAVPAGGRAASPNAAAAASPNAACFLLNGNRQSWHYGWQSSRLNCKNLHVFKVYVFTADAASDGVLQCVAALASPAFRISSSRKARKTFRAPATPVGAALGHSAAPGAANGGSPPSGVPSIDEFLAAPAAAAAYAPPPASAYAQRDPARRERKRLTRSASLKTDYFTAVSLPQPVQQPQPQPQPQRPVQRLSLSSTHPPRFEGVSEDRSVAPALPGVGSFLGASAGVARSFHSRRSSLAALPVPVSAPLGLSRPRPRPVPVLTPITGMMQLRLESHPTPRDAGYSRPGTPSTASTASSTASSAAAGPPPVPTRLSAAALHQHAYSSARPYAYVRRESWSNGVGGGGGLGLGLGGGIPMMQMAGFGFGGAPGAAAAAADSYLNRKRNRSTDSDKAITAAIEASEKIKPTMSRPATVTASASASPALAPVPTDSALYRRARILQLAFTVVKRIHGFEEVAAKAESESESQAPPPAQARAQSQSQSQSQGRGRPRRVYRHSFEMVTPPVAPRSKSSLVQIPLSNPKLLLLCSNLVTVCTALVGGGLLEELRQKLQDCAQSGRGVLGAYAQAVDVLDEAVGQQVAKLPRRRHKSWGDAESADDGEWDLYEMLKSCEPWLLQEPWWVVLDDDDAAQRGDGEDASMRPLPYVRVFADYYRAVQDAVPSAQDLEVAASLRDAALTGGGGLTGEWQRQPEPDERLQPQRAVALAAARSASAASSLSWLARCIHAHMTQVLHVTETPTTMTLTLPHSLVSASSVFLLQLDRQEPTVVQPQDYFPFGWTRRRTLVAYRAWRVRAMGDKNGSAVAVQFMRWPDGSEAANELARAGEQEQLEADEDEDENGNENEPDQQQQQQPLEPEEEPKARRRTRRLRTRITIYFSVFSPTTLQLRTIVEASLAPATLSAAATPSESDMLQYFKSPSSWEMRSQVSQQYEKNL